MNIREVFTYLAMSRAELRNTFAAALAKVGLSGAEAAVVYEQSMSTGFGQSCRGYVLLRYLGYPKIRVLHGGYAAWVAAGGYPARRRFCQQMLGSLKAWEADCPSGAPMLFVISNLDSRRESRHESAVTGGLRS